MACLALNFGHSALMDFQPCVYILASQKHGTLYIGVTSDIMRRIGQHRDGTFKGFTFKYKIYVLVLAEYFTRMDDAIGREKQLKRWHREWKINLIEAGNSGWRDLAEDFGFEALLPRGREAPPYPSC